MSVEELIQLMRTCSLGDIRGELEELNSHGAEEYETIVLFYKAAAKRTKKRTK